MMLAARMVGLLLVLSAPVYAVSDDVVETKAMLKTLRFQEDRSALADPDVVTDHWYPGIKYIELGEDWTASFGGQARLRMHSEKNRALTGATVRRLRRRQHPRLHVDRAGRTHLLQPAGQSSRRPRHRRGQR